MYKLIFLGTVFVELSGTGRRLDWGPAGGSGRGPVVVLVWRRLTGPAASRSCEYLHAFRLQRAPLWSSVPLLLHRRHRGRARARRPFLRNCPLPRGLCMKHHSSYQPVLAAALTSRLTILTVPWCFSFGFFLFVVAS